MSERPMRIQRKRTKGWKMPEGAVYVGRGSRWGNPHTVADWGSAEMAVLQFEHDCNKAEIFHPDEFREWIAPLRGKSLMCWCGPDAPCHADVLLEIANAEPSP